MVSLVKRNLKGLGGCVVLSIVTLFLQAMADLYLPTLNADITNNGMARGDVPYVIRVGLFMLVIVVLGVICMITSSYFSSVASCGLGRNMRDELFCHIETLSREDLEKVGTASLITRATNDITQVQTASMMMLRMMLMSPIMFFGGIIMALKKSFALSWIIVVCLPFIVILIAVLLKKGMPLFKTIQGKIDNVNMVVREYLSGIRVIRAFIKDDYEKKRFDSANMDLCDVSLKVGRMMALLMPIMMLIVNAANILIVWVGGHYMVNGIVQVGDLTAFITYVAMILSSVMMMSMMFIMLPRASASADRINEVLSIESTVVTKAEPKAFSDNKKGSIRFEDVSFSYPDAENSVLEHISFETNPGEITAIIGGTGSGKSTLLNLIPRFYDVTSGKVLIDGLDVRDVAIDVLREKIGVIPQKSFLFSGTIADNIRFGKEDATDEEIFEALRIAQAYDFVMEKENNISEPITQGGTNVSGGQRQRLAIARALVRKPEIYLFDDSFSALDFKTDSLLRAALSEEIAKSGSTVLIVAQRVSTIMNADRILVLDDGKIVGMGKHDELMASCDVYREIVYSQHNESEVG